MKKLALIFVFMILLGSVSEKEYQKLNVHQIVHLHERLQKELQRLFPDCAITQIIEANEQGNMNYYGACLEEKKKEKDNRI